MSLLRKLEIPILVCFVQTQRKGLPPLVLQLARLLHVVGEPFDLLPGISRTIKLLFKPGDLF